MLLFLGSLSCLAFFHNLRVPVPFTHILAVFLLKALFAVRLSHPTGSAATILVRLHSHKPTAAKPVRQFGVRLHTSSKVGQQAGSGQVKDGLNGPHLSTGRPREIAFPGAISVLVNRCGPMGSQVTEKRCPIGRGSKSGLLFHASLIRLAETAGKR